MKKRLIAGLLLLVMAVGMTVNVMADFEDNPPKPIIQTGAPITPHETEAPEDL